MIAQTARQVAETVAGVIEGDLDPATLVSGKVEFDSRRVRPGDAFLAFVGEQADGHDFIAAAMAAGAALAITTRPVPGGCIRVADPIEAISALAAAQAPKLRARIVGVTGSSGKTSTKDLLAQLLSVLGPTVAPPGSFNNELGYPYTVLLADERTEFLVLETSARGIGHIAHLAEIARPQLGVVLNVGRAHLGEFGSVAAIAQAKGELVEALPAAAEGGVAILNADDPAVLAMAARTQARIVRFGEHQVSNALAAAAVALECGLSLPATAAALSAAVAQSHWRMEITELASGLTLVNDAYNANPESMRAALKSLAIMSGGRRSVAVLGHMGELGEQANAEHDSLGRLAVRFDIGHLIAVGEQARPIAHGAALEGSWNGESEWVPDVEAAIARLAEILEPGDVVLVKGSRAAGMERVAAAIADAASAEGANADDASAPGAPA
ncbi:MAG: murF [Frankiales bacterium]|nr:murF [Frankiales bacterium]